MNKYHIIYPVAGSYFDVTLVADSFSHEGNWVTFYQHYTGPSRESKKRVLGVFKNACFTLEESK